MVTSDEVATPANKTIKSLFALVPTAVAVVTVGSGTQRYGATIGTLGALSLNPPLLMFALKQDAGLVGRLKVGAQIGINVLGVEQEDVALRFATPGIDRFATTRWCEERALPRLDSAMAWATGSVRDQLPLGDHVLITAIVGHTETEIGLPLIYWQRHFTSLVTEVCRHE
ncbi:hypothetical protein GCM10007913_25620 [Devosia yakushimensis]|uniref:Flavin reductase like domain-containing protein n=1 Tax=Devosia yakushimensis TaxID=470028 RepID=A0ABQ5UHF8_9HYPH|nr:flavin reductase family protein [Devosia yakushimensis]GLQ10630.1 hypothetical protein GCM10007913_25620 [Devosia yakushimensis]